MKKLLTLVAIGLICLSGYAQKFPLTDVTDHYKTLQEVSSKPNSARSFMDTIKYPPAEYGNSIVYLLVKPYYLSDAEVKRLTQSASFPANSSDQVRAELDYMLDLQAKRTPEQVKRVE